MASRLLPLLLAAACAVPASAAELGVLAPVLDHGQPLTRPGPDGHPAPVVERLAGGALFDALQVQAREGFTATMLALDERAQRVAGARDVQPTWLYLSAEEGGFARRGFWLREGSAQRFVADPFVDLVVDADSIADGSFEEIFAHEQGHVLLRRLLPSLPAGWSRTAHASLALTDRPTAFDEGFATHFQALARLATRNARLRQADAGLADKPFLGAWASRIDGALRIDGVRRNLFVQAQALPAGAGDALARRDASTYFDRTRLKDGDQMLASEGVVATVFYRWLAPGDLGAAALVDRYAPWFAALRALDGEHPGADDPVLVRLLQRYAAQAAPDAAATAVRTFVETTLAATIDPAIARDAEALAVPGRIGDVEAFVPALQAARTALQPVVDAAIADPRVLDDALAEPLWVQADAPAGPGATERRFVDLNIAEREELLVAPGIDAALADHILDVRRSGGGFADWEAFVRRADVPVAAAARLRDARDAARAAGPYARN